MEHLEKKDAVLMAYVPCQPFVAGDVPQLARTSS